MIPSQMLKGTLEGCIMAIISRQPTYGYEIAEQLKNYGFGQIAEGTIYPLLLRLEKKDGQHRPQGHQKEGDGKGEQKDPPALAALVHGHGSKPPFEENIPFYSSPKQSFPFPSSVRAF